MAELASEGSQNVRATESKSRRTKKSKTAQNRFNGPMVEGDLEDEGSDYASSLQSDATSDSDHESDVVEITNEELAHLLPSKTVPEQQNRRNKPKRLAKSRLLGHLPAAEFRPLQLRVQKKISSMQQILYLIKVLYALSRYSAVSPSHSLCRQIEVASDSW
ncbi:hypothetical protein BDR04DRAFT_1229147, partial [Suillus decipiens]